MLICALVNCIGLRSFATTPPDAASSMIRIAGSVPSARCISVSVPPPLPPDDSLRCFQILSVASPNTIGRMHVFSQIMIDSPDGGFATQGMHFQHGKRFARDSQSSEFSGAVLFVCQ